MQTLTVPMPPFADGLIRVGKFSGITLHRQERWQTQLWLCDPNSEIPDHAHPHVDVMQLYVGGNLALRHKGEQVIHPEALRVGVAGLAMMRGAMLRVRPGETHGATIGPEGAAFITFQRWLDSEPTSVELDWEGEALSPEHAAKIGHELKAA